MPGRAKAKTSAKSKAKAKAKAKAANTARRLREQQLNRANSRQKSRREALSELNTLTTELQLAARPLVCGRDRNEQVERRVRLLQRRCPDDAFRNRLHAAALLYTENGGAFSAEVVRDSDDVGMEVPKVAKHKVLQGSFRLQSEAFMLTYHSREFTGLVWPEFEQFVKDLSVHYGCRAWAACLEAGTTAETQDRCHLHAYFYWTDGHGIDLRSTDSLAFRQVRPRVDARAAATTPLAAKVAAYHGLWYVSVMKLGTMHTATNFFAWRDYTPFASWVDGLWSSKKLSAVQFPGLARDVGAGYAKRKRDAQEVMRDELEASIHAHNTAELKDLQLLSPRAFAEVDEFVGLFQGKGRWRRPMLVLLAPTNLGKSMLAEHILRRVAAALALPSYVEVTVEADEHLDLSEYNHSKHSGVLLDGVGDVMLLKRNREMLQGRPKTCKGGKSATNMYAYPFTLCRRAVVVTMDMGVANLELLYTDHWLSNRKNVMVLKLDTPAWKCESVPVPLVPTDPRATVAGWSASEVKSFLVGKDLAGPASALHQSGVNGTDLLAMTVQVLAEDLRLSRFAARKVLSVLDSYTRS